jgi:ribosome-associated toxin RatA of RatAB toxin-antitoxin module
MRFWFRSFTEHCPGAWMVLFGAAIILALGFAAQASTGEVIRSRLDKGEIIVSAREVPDSSVKHAEMTGIIDAPPEVVWQVITDVNSFKYFMPRTLNSLEVTPEQVAEIVKKQPTQAKEVEKLLGTAFVNPANYRVPGGKYTVYHYSDLELPWPCSNRWYIIKGIMDETQAAQHRYHSSWSLVIGNLKTNSGEWILEPYGNHQTKAIYRINTDPGGAIPGFLVQEGTTSTMPQIIKAVRERAAKLCQAG